MIKYLITCLCVSQCYLSSSEIPNDDKFSYLVDKFLEEREITLQLQKDNLKDFSSYCYHLGKVLSLNDCLNSLYPDNWNEDQYHLMEDIYIIETLKLID